MEISVFDLLSQLFSRESLTVRFCCLFNLLRFRLILFFSDEFSLLERPTCSNFLKVDRERVFYGGHEGMRNAEISQRNLVTLLLFGLVSGRSPPGKFLFALVQHHVMILVSLSLFRMQVEPCLLRPHIKALGLLSVFVHFDRLVFARNTTFLASLGQRFSEGLRVVLLRFHAGESPRGHRVLMLSVPVSLIIEWHLMSCVVLTVFWIILLVMVIRCLRLRLSFVLGCVSKLLLSMLNIMESFLLKAVDFVSRIRIGRHLSRPAEKLRSAVMELRSIALSVE